MTTGTLTKHAHKFEIDSHNTGVCKCGEMRQFMANESNGNMRDQTFKVIHAGDPNYADDASPDKPTDVPLKPKGRIKIIAYYEANKESILADYRAIGNEPTRAKWGISSSGWVGLKRRWLGNDAIKSQYAHHVKKNKSPAGKKPEKKEKKCLIPLGKLRIEVADGLPAFPPFSDNWTPEVQLEWLQIYKALKQGEKN